MSILASTSKSLSIANLHVKRGQLDVLHGVNLQVGERPVTVLGRNGVGKSTLCAALLGLLPVAKGTIRFDGVELAGKRPDQIADLGIAIVPQGRRVFPSLTVDEHFRLLEGRRPGEWNRARVYGAFPRLAERRKNFGNELSGGEQQMLAIGRALMANPRFMILDEPSEGLAPKIVEDVLDILNLLVQLGIGILLVEQNLSVGTRASETIAIMSAGQIDLVTTASALLADEEMQRRFLGVATT